jgi:predicted permease
MLARASTREREISVRLALGASRRRLVSQLLTESLLLAATGAVAGTLLAQVLGRFLVSFLSTQEDPVFVDLHLDWRVLAFNAGLAMLTCVLFGLAPAVRATRAHPGTVMKANSRGLTAGRERFGLRRALVVSQVALSCVLLVGALLFVRSLHNLLTVDAGFQQSGILITGLDLTPLDLPKERRQPFQQELLEKVRNIPGVESAAGASLVPISGNSWNNNVRIPGVQYGNVYLNSVTPGYFATMGTPFMAGRDFTERDTISAPRIAIVNQVFASRYLHGVNPIGATFRMDAWPGATDYSYEIVGLVENTKYRELREQFEPLAFFPAAQDESPDQFAGIVIRSSTSLGGILSAVRRTIAEISPAINIDSRIFQTQIHETLVRDRLMATLSGFFGGLAVLLATIGLYGVMAYMVVRRRNEIGIRIALGADRSQIVRMILREAGLLLVLGLAAGVALALAAGQAASALLFGLSANDPATYFMAVAALAAVALLASYLPARRAANLEPTIALREE